MDILDLIASDNYIPYNRTLAKEIGLENAILFGALCGYQRVFKTEEFFREQEKLIDETCLSEYSVRKSIKELKELELIFVVKKGMPAKYYFKINTTRLIDLLTTSGCENNTTGACENNSTYNNKNNDKNKNINKESKQDNYNSIVEQFGLESQVNNEIFEFIKMRKQIKKPMTNRALTLMINKLNKLSNGNSNTMIKILDQSILNCWQDIYALKSEQKNKNNMWDNLEEAFKNE